MARTLNSEEFAAECDRRLMDRFEVMLHLGLRNRTAVDKRIAAGTFPPPMVQKANVSLWDKESLPNRNGGA